MTCNNGRGNVWPRRARPVIHASVKYRAVIFDAGNVLLKRSPPEILRAALTPGADFDRYLRGIFAPQRWLDLDRGVVEERDVVPEFAASLGTSDDEIAHILSVARDSLVPLAPGMQLLEEFAASGRDVFCLTNMSGETFAHLRAKYAFWTAFKGVVVSGHLKIAKPDPAIYRHTLETHRLDPATTLFLDDHLANVESARTLGITSVQYDGSDTCVAHVRALARLP